MSEDESPLRVEGVAGLRDWLSRNGDAVAGVWLVRPRKGKAGHMPIRDLTRTLLCFGWVDSSVKKLDDTASLIRIAPRSPNSAWSALNKRLVDDARRDGEMTPRGEALVAAAKANGMWEFLDDVEAGIVPEDLARALNAAKARETFDRFPFSSRRGILEWIKQAKRADTRAKRIARTAALAARGIRALSPDAKGL